ncbi:hypothetical protein Salmuc_01670 [Salipiger mucosus DSM 16094]|uniref:Uncharacterized protein n=1 Tax=Salipiger mucosus DSM 16094 TaxID=1123237 RepID=S9S0Y3_9RHOB|nr:hypothetical protein Salmuc_01670 [Salipiger mucosus DSM 16094]
MTVVMAARTPSDYALVNSMLFSRMAVDFPLRAHRTRTGKFRISVSETPDPLRPTKQGPAPRRRMKRGELIHDHRY